MYVVNNYIVCLFVQGTAEKQLADAVSLVKKLEKKKIDGIRVQKWLYLMPVV